jgi:hypothetical protein
MSLTDKEHEHVAACLQNIADALIAKDAEIERLRAEVEQLREAQGRWSYFYDEKAK